VTVRPGSGVYHPEMDRAESRAAEQEDQEDQEDQEGRSRFPSGRVVDARQMWANNRFWMETQNLVTRRDCGRR
jgi:hypothetical protein